MITKELTVREIRLLQRYPVSRVYTEVIEEDLKFAIENLPQTYPISAKGRVTSLAAAGLLAKVYLTQKKYSLAKNELERIIDSGVYMLLPVITDVFRSSNEYNSEILFAVRFKKGEGSEGHSLSFDYIQNQTVSPELQELYDLDDDRYALVQVYCYYRR